MKRHSALKTSGIITLTTDFGNSDTFAGQIKGVILSINKMVNIVDITHNIPPFSIQDAAYAINSAYRYYPIGTIHIVVVDPEVGSERRALLVHAHGHFFIGPDNGVFSYMLSRDGNKTCVALTERRYFIKDSSPTFQGRDVFAPAAGWLSRGLSIDELGERVENAILLEHIAPVVSDNSIKGTVIHIDRFGNIITNITVDILDNRPFRASLRGIEARSVKCYLSSKGYGLSCLINSSGELEFFVFRGNASEIFNIKRGDDVEVYY